MTEKLKCVLLVDDDEAVNFINRMVLSRVDCAERIDIAENGMEAIRYLEAQAVQGAPQPELIFLDINMPLLNGWEFLDKYIELKEKLQAEASIVMLTTSSNPDDRSRAESMTEVKAFVSKPLTVEKLEGIMAMIRGGEMS